MCVNFCGVYITLYILCMRIVVASVCRLLMCVNSYGRRYTLMIMHRMKMIWETEQNVV